MVDHMMNATGYELARTLFLHGMGLNYLFAFWSLYKQAGGLYGSEGVAPIRSFLGGLESHYGKKLFKMLPTLFWFRRTDPFIRGMALAGLLLSGVATLGFFQAPLFLILWVIYLSFVNADDTFLSFQWDCLLLETGVAAFLLALQPTPNTLVIGLLWLLLFRFMFSSGYAKLVHGSSQWRDLTAMRYHYETQPLPNKIAYYAHRQPLWFAKLSTLAVHLIEAGAPFLIFFPDPLRFTGFCILLFLQILIMLTGSYAFFNTLSIALLIPLLPNGKLDWLPISQEAGTSGGPVVWIVSLCASVLILLQLVLILELFLPGSRKLRNLLAYLSPIKLAVRYGLFVHMTTWRDEIVIEGSRDGENWKPYGFKWKPGKLSKAPAQAAPYHPRLDWQMWFAALSTEQHNPWFRTLLLRLLQGSEEVLKLLNENPFPDAPPRYIRALQYRYRFTDPQKKRETGEWWERRHIGRYSNILTLREGP